MALYKKVTAFKRGKTWSYRFEGKKKIVENEFGVLIEKRDPVVKGGFKTKAEAIDAGNRKMHELFDNDGSNIANMTVNQLFTKYIKACEANGQKDTAIKKKVYIIKPQLLNKIGNLKLEKVTRLHAEEIGNAIKTSGKAPNTINGYLSAINQMFSYGVKLELINKNPFDIVDRVRSGKQVNPNKAYTAEEMQAFLTTYKDNIILFTVIMLCYHAGLRISEACGLTWDNVDFENKTITVNKQLIKHQDKQLYLESPKYNSCDTIAVDDTLIEYLKELKPKINRKTYAQDENGKLIDGNDFTFVLTKRNGKAIIRQDITSKLFDQKRQCHPVFNPHSLRHTYATILYQNCGNIKYVQNQVRHKNASTTLNVYTHLSQEAKRQEDNKLNEWFK